MQTKTADNSYWGYWKQGIDAILFQLYSSVISLIILTLSGVIFDYSWALSIAMGIFLFFVVIIPFTGWLARKYFALSNSGRQAERAQS
ncbi:MAG: hypothetical protein MO847_04335 [Candidatus Protistobacter heckmanni]|nr:hypothetical protein [Candidatus Protistobacter heckmanni]